MAPQTAIAALFFALLNDLPMEIITSIFEHLSSKDLHMLSAIISLRLRDIDTDTLRFRITAARYAHIHLDLSKLVPRPYNKASFTLMTLLNFAHYKETIQSITFDIPAVSALNDRLVKDTMKRVSGGAVKVITFSDECAIYSSRLLDYMASDFLPRNPQLRILYCPRLSRFVDHGLSIGLHIHIPGEQNQIFKDMYIHMDDSASIVKAACANKPDGGTITGIVLHNKDSKKRIGFPGPFSNIKDLFPFKVTSLCLKKISLKKVVQSFGTFFDMSVIGNLELIDCPGQDDLLPILSGKLKPKTFKYASNSTLSKDGHTFASHTHNLLRYLASFSGLRAFSYTHNFDVDEMRYTELFPNDLDAATHELMQIWDHSTPKDGQIRFNVATLLQTHLQSLDTLYLRQPKKLPDPTELSRNIFPELKSLGIGMPKLISLVEGSRQLRWREFDDDMKYLMQEIDDLSFLEYLLLITPPTIKNLYSYPHNDDGQHARPDDAGPLRDVAHIVADILSKRAPRLSAISLTTREGGRWSGIPSYINEMSVHLLRQDGQWTQTTLLSLDKELATWENSSIESNIYPRRRHVRQMLSNYEKTKSGDDDCNTENRQGAREFHDRMVSAEGISNDAPAEVLSETT